MEKIPTLFQRNFEGDHLVRDEITPGAEWVTLGEGIDTRKWDGTCCLIREGKLYKRYELKSGKKAPEGFEPVTGIDPITGKQQGWVPVGDGPDDKYHREAFEKIAEFHPTDGTYELVGPKVKGNSERFNDHELIYHKTSPIVDTPRDYLGLYDFFHTHNIEGIVWHHPDGRMVKIKAKDFGISRKPLVRKE